MASLGNRHGKIYVDFRVNGERYREQTGIVDTPTNLKKARFLLKRLEAEITLGTFDYSKYFPNGKNASKFLARKARLERGGETPMSFEVFTETWFKEKRVEWSESYTNITKYTLDKHIIPRFCGKRVDEITKADILAFRSEISTLPGHGGRTLSGNRINQVVNMLREILREAAERFDFKEPGQNIKRVPEKRPQVDPFNFNEAHLMINRVRPDYRCYLLVRLFTGLRSSEADGLTWDNVDFDARQILVRKALVQGKLGDTKTPGSVREIDISNIVYDALVEHHKSRVSDQFVFCSQNGQPINNGNFTKRVWYPLLRHLGLRLRRPYQTRHTTATMWLAAGESPEWIARQLGHANTKMLFEVYSRYVPNLTRQDGSAFENLLNTSLNGRYSAGSLAAANGHQPPISGSPTAP